MINDAQAQEAAATNRDNGRNLRQAVGSVEIDTAVSGRTKAEPSLTMEAVVTRSNMMQAYQRVVENKGAAGVDNLRVSDLKPWLKQHWLRVKETLIEGGYLPRAIRKVDIPKPDGNVRTLGVPTVADRLIQQADLDKELERRGHSFCRYADDCNIYVGSQKAGEHLLADISQFLSRELKLQVNKQKSAVARPWKRKFLGYSFTWHKQARVKIAPQSVARLKDKIRSLTTGHCSRSVAKAIKELTPILRGWMSYFRLTQVKGILEDLDGWIRRKLRCLLWRQWKRPFTRATNLMKAAMTEKRAWISATNQRDPWWNAGASHMNQAFKKVWFDKLGLVSLLDCHRQFQC